MLGRDLRQQFQILSPTKILEMKLIISKMEKDAVRMRIKLQVNGRRLNTEVGV